MDRPEPTNRHDRQRERTRAVLLDAARELLAAHDPAELTVQDITDAADVGVGSFYNHFPTKTQLFEVVVDEVLIEQGALLDAVLAGTADPAERFGTGVRLVGRLPSYHPQMADVMARIGLRHVSSSQGIGPRALRDLRQARADGRFTFRDAEAALYTTVGALMGIGRYVAARPDRLGHAVDDLALQLMLGFGLPAPDARQIMRRRLPVPAPGRATAGGRSPRRPVR